MTGGLNASPVALRDRADEVLRVDVQLLDLLPARVEDRRRRAELSAGAAHRSLRGRRRARALIGAAHRVGGAVGEEVDDVTRAGALGGRGACSRMSVEISDVTGSSPLVVGQIVGLADVLGDRPEVGRAGEAVGEIDDRRAETNDGELHAGQPLVKFLDRA